jgi:hypothetical protein
MVMEFGSSSRNKIKSKFPNSSVEKLKISEIEKEGNAKTKRQSCAALLF